MQYRDSIFGTLLKAIDRRAFAGSVERHDGDRYVKNFSAWDHLVVLLYAQLGGTASLRAVEAGWNAHAHHHYHLGCGPVRRSTLSDAGQRRPAAIFAETFGQLSHQADRRFKRDGAAMVRLIDSSPIELGKLCAWADWNGRTCGLKLHVVYDPATDHPRQIAITPATVNDITLGRALPSEPGATYVFDKGYCDYAWWTRLDAAGCRFVTRSKSNVRFTVESVTAVPLEMGDGFLVLDDAIVRLAGQGRARLPIRLRRVRVRTADARVLSVISNDLERPATAIASLYKTRWQIELLFRWIKQNLKIRSFLGRSEAAIRLQILAAMIAFLLLRLAARHARSLIPPIRFAGLVRDCLFTRKSLNAIDRPPETYTPTPHSDPNQFTLAFA
ncbi:IS4 family transposase [Azospirillum sp.]|uniref:IS4 family transposase n=1 Tax=Azospirillum sp. TaxID=34012 RepID=UPI003D72FAB8